MKSRFFNSTIKPVLGVFLLSLIAIIFITISTINTSLDHELQQSEAFIGLVTKDLSTNLNDIVVKMQETSVKLSINSIIFDLEMNGIEDTVYHDIMYGAFKSHEMVVGSVLTSNSELKMLSMFDGSVEEANMVYYSNQWFYNNSYTSRYNTIRLDNKNYLLLELPASMENPDYQIGLIIDPSFVLRSYFRDYPYNIHMLANNGAEILLADDHEIINELQNQYGATYFNQLGPFNRSKYALQVSDMHYYHETILVSDYYQNITIIISKPYRKFAMHNISNGLTTRVLIFGILMIAVVATIVYSSQKTKQWIETDKQFLSDIVEMDKFQISELNKELKFYKDYFIESKLPVLFVNKESFRIVNVNQAAIEYYGYTEDELNEMYLTDICQWEETHDTGLMQVDHINRSGKKEKKIVRLHEGIFNDTDLLIIKVIIDRDADLSSDDFKMEMFHEIRSPLQGAVGAVEMIERASDNFGEYTSIIKRSLNNVLMLTNNVLANGKLNQLKSRVLKADVDLVQLVDEVISTTVYQDRHYNLIAGQVQENIDDVLTVLNSYIINTDGIKLRQILLNLVSNASKYTVDGIVNVTVDVTRKENEDVLVFRVTDTGRGLSKEEIQQIYDEYSTFADDANVTSTGIGMSITKKYVELLGSELHINSEVGVGTTFSFSLLVPATNRHIISITEKKSVLVVDDDEISCDYIKHLLEKELKCYVKTITNESALFTELNHNHYDLLMIDQNLNHYNGIDLIRLVKASINKRVTEIPIIMMTAGSTKDDYENLIETHIHDVIIKPFENEKVIQILADLFNVKEDYQHELCHLLNAEIVEKKVLCETFETVGKEVFVELIQKFIINSSEEILMITERAEKGDFRDIAGMLHRLKGSMSYFGPVECQRLILQLEPLAQNENIAFMDIYRDFVEAHKRLVGELEIIKTNL